jgi:hypothetical protein
LGPPEKADQLGGIKGNQIRESKKRELKRRELKKSEPWARRVITLIT